MRDRKKRISDQDRLDVQERYPRAQIFKVIGKDGRERGGKPAPLFAIKKVSRTKNWNNGIK